MSSTPSGRDRRRFARISLASRVQVTLKGTAARRQLLLENISKEGLFIRAPKPKPVGSKLKFEFAVRDGAPAIVGEGVVRWIEEDPSKMTGMGIQFTQLNDEGRREISRILQDLKKGTAK